jgi:hypothetical protein
MKKLPVSLIKYLVLLVTLIAVICNLIFKTPDKSTLLFILIGFAAVYIFLSVTEFLKQLEKSTLPYDRFFYLPLSVVSVKVIKLGAIVITGLVLFLSQSSLIYLGTLLLIILLSDLLVFLLRLRKKVYYVSLFANYILFALEEETKVFASQIETIEYRYDIFYLKAKNNKTYPIEIARMQKTDQPLFTEKFVLWVVCNKLVFTPEAKEKLADIISEAL